MDERVDERARRRVLVAVMLAIFLAAIESTVVALAMPTVVASLGGLHVYSWVFSGYLLTQTVTMPLWCRFSDLYGRRAVCLVVLPAFFAGSSLSGAARGPADRQRLVGRRLLHDRGHGRGAGARRGRAGSVVVERRRAGPSRGGRGGARRVRRRRAARRRADRSPRPVREPDARRGGA